MLVGVLVCVGVDVFVGVLVGVGVGVGVAQGYVNKQSSHEDSKVMLTYGYVLVYVVAVTHLTHPLNPEDSI